MSATFLTRQGRDAAGVAVSGRQSREVDVGQRVAGDDQERFVAEELPAGTHPARGAEQLLLVAVGEALPEVVLDRIGEVVEVRDHILEPVPREQLEDVLHTGRSSTGTIGFVIS